MSESQSHEELLKFTLQLDDSNVERETERAQRKVERAVERRTGERSRPGGSLPTDGRPSSRVPSLPSVPSTRTIGDQIGRAMLDRFSPTFGRIFGQQAGQAASVLGNALSMITGRNSNIHRMLSMWARMETTARRVTGGSAGAPQASQAPQRYDSPTRKMIEPPALPLPAARQSRPQSPMQAIRQYWADQTNEKAEQMARSRGGRPADPRSWQDVLRAKRAGVKDLSNVFGRLPGLEAPPWRPKAPGVIGAEEMNQATDAAMRMRSNASKALHETINHSTTMLRGTKPVRLGVTQAESGGSKAAQLLQNAGPGQAGKLPGIFGRIVSGGGAGGTGAVGAGAGAAGGGGILRGLGGLLGGAGGAGGAGAGAAGAAGMGGMMAAGAASGGIAVAVLLALRNLMKGAASVGHGAGQMVRSVGDADASGFIQGGIKSAGGTGRMAGGIVLGPLVEKLAGVVGKAVSSLDHFVGALAKWNPAIMGEQKRYEAMQIMFRVRQARVMEPLLTAWIKLKEGVLSFMDSLMNSKAVVGLFKWLGDAVKGVGSYFAKFKPIIAYAGHAFGNLIDIVRSVWKVFSVLSPAVSIIKLGFSILGPVIKGVALGLAYFELGLLKFARWIADWIPKMGGFVRVLDKKIAEVGDTIDEINGKPKDDLRSASNAANKQFFDGLRQWTSQHPPTAGRTPGSASSSPGQTGSSGKTQEGAGRTPGGQDAIPHFARGGIVPGHGRRDTVRAMLTPGELVLNAAQQSRLAMLIGRRNTLPQAEWVSRSQSLEKQIKAQEKALEQIGNERQRRAAEYRLRGLRRDKLMADRHSANWRESMLPGNGESFLPGSSDPDTRRSILDFKPNMTPAERHEQAERARFESNWQRGQQFQNYPDLSRGSRPQGQVISGRYLSGLRSVSISTAAGYDNSGLPGEKKKGFLESTTGISAAAIIDRAAEKVMGAIFPASDQAKESATKQALGTRQQRTPLPPILITGSGAGAIPAVPDKKDPETGTGLGMGTPDYHKPPGTERIEGGHGAGQFIRNILGGARRTLGTLGQMAPKPSGNQGGGETATPHAPQPPPQRPTTRPSGGVPYDPLNAGRRGSPANARSGAGPSKGGGNDADPTSPNAPSPSDGQSNVPQKQKQPTNSPSDGTTGAGSMPPVTINQSYALSICNDKSVLDAINQVRQRLLWDLTTARDQAMLAVSMLDSRNLLDLL